MVGDILGSGGRSAQFSTGGSKANEPVELKKAEPKFPEKQDGAFKPILERVLIKRVAEDKNMEQLEDGSMRDKRTGFIIPAKYRQHSNVGVVLAVGDFVVMGGVKTPLSDI